jgi:hypothetical protein
VPQDYAQAVAWWRKAADQGFAGAQYNLGMMYAHGEGVPQDYAQAITWYRKAANQGFMGAQNNLGMMYRNGQGVKQSRVTAYALFNLAALIEPTDKNPAIGNRANLVNDMSKSEIEAAQKLTREMTKPGNFLMALDKYPN